MLGTSKNFIKLKSTQFEDQLAKLNKMMRRMDQDEEDESRERNEVENILKDYSAKIEGKYKSDK